MKIFNKFIDKFRPILIPLILIGIVIVSIISAIIIFVRDFFIVNCREIILSIGIIVFVVPIAASCITGWEIPSILILYDFIFGFVVLIMLAGATDRKHGDGYNGEEGYNNSGKTYSNTYNPFNTEKERNGGLTDKEVKIKKELIRKRLLEITKEKVTNE